MVDGPDFRIGREWQVELLERGESKLVAISYHGSANVLQALPLASAAPFDRPEWFHLLESVGGLQPFIAAAQDECGSAVFPLMQPQANGNPLAEWQNIFWRPLFSHGADTQALLTAIARDLAGKRSHVSLTHVPNEDGSADLLAGAFRNAGWVVIPHECGANRTLRLAGRNFDEYLSGRPGPLRSGLRRCSALLEISVSSRFNPDSWQEYEAVRHNVWQRDERSAEIMRRFAQEEGAAGRLRLGIARLRGRAIAAQFWTVEADTAWVHDTAQAEAGRQLSAGMALTAALLEQAIDHDKVQSVDFGIGDDAYPDVWSEEMQPRFRLDCHRPGNPKSWPSLAVATARKLASKAASG